MFGDFDRILKIKFGLADGFVLFCLYFGIVIFSLKSWISWFSYGFWVPYFGILIWYDLKALMVFLGVLYAEFSCIWACPSGFWGFFIWTLYAGEEVHRFWSVLSDLNSKISDFSLVLVYTEGGSTKYMEAYNLLRRPDGTFNRHLAEFLDRKVPANANPLNISIYIQNWYI